MLGKHVCVQNALNNEIICIFTLNFYGKFDKRFGMLTF